MFWNTHPYVQVYSVCLMRFKFEFHYMCWIVSKIVRLSDCWRVRANNFMLFFQSISSVLPINRMRKIKHKFEFQQQEQRLQFGQMK